MSQYYVNVNESGIIDVETLTGNSGGAVGPSAGNINILGAGAVNVVGNPSTHTLTISISGGSSLTWSATAIGLTMVAGHGYFNTQTTGAPNIFALPATAALGDTYAVACVTEASQFWVGTGAGQSLYYGISDVSGSGQYVQLNTNSGVIFITCMIANTTFIVTSSTGNFTFT